MTSTWPLLALAATVALYTLAIVMLVAAGRSHVRSLAGFIPDCLVVLRRLLRDPRIPRRRKTILILLVAYLAMPIDPVPAFIPSPDSSTT
jgi:hypothetical protein